MTEVAVRPPRRLRLAHARHTILGAVLATAVAALALAQAARRLVLNPSPSAPQGLYLVFPGRIAQAGDYALLPVPPAIRDLVRGRDYLPSGIPLLKRVLAIGPVTACVRDGVLTVHGTPVTRVLPTDSLHRPLPVSSFCGPLPAETAFVAGHDKHSLDSRNFGPVPIKTLTPARPIWTF